MDEDRLQVFWITQKLKSLSLSNKKIYIYSEKLKFVGIKCRDNSENKYDNHQFFAVIWKTFNFGISTWTTVAKAVLNAAKCVHQF